MDSSPDEILIEIPYFVRVYKDGRVDKIAGTSVVPAGIDPNTGVQSKDVVISPETNAFVRIYIPKTANLNVKKLPLLVYFHGGAFIIETAASPTYHNFLNLVSSESNVVVVSVDYRTAPEHPVPACFDDSWEAVKWVAQHVNGNGPNTWLNDYTDFSHVFFAGDSAGGNLAHHMAIRVGSENLGRVSGESLNLEGIILLHPYFWGKDRMGSESDHPWTKAVEELWLIAHPGTSGSDDPLINPDKDPKVSDLGCSRVLVCVAGKDVLKDRGIYYKVILGKNGWKGNIEVIEDKEEDHVFFLNSPLAEISCTLRKRICTFINN
ncbi:alpha/beta-Hydrolases superfamily protein [Artemisia annua]|uniref:Alpha/beta-Hydrolases superfamily protein n=1 Tax=Artemisia annua TaxID=35608 RepID=A0A2U1Q2D0_ARTAN|nr:alpha/beta-Hydrolases superfamily protein [Artemisia annua]